MDDGARTDGDPLAAVADAPDLDVLAHQDRGARADVPAQHAAIPQVSDRVGWDVADDVVRDVLEDGGQRPAYPRGPRRGRRRADGRVCGPGAHDHSASRTPSAAAGADERPLLR